MRTLIHTAVLPAIPSRLVAAWVLVLVLACAGAGPAFAQSAEGAAPQAEASEERTFRPVRFWGGIGGAVAVDIPVMYALSTVWYGEDERQSFHWYSDVTPPGQPSDIRDNGWLDDWNTYAQQDKLGHVWVTWHLTRAVGAYGRWAGLSDGQAALFGGVVSTLFQTQIEVYDGFSNVYGASRTDILANAVGGVVGGLQVAYPERTGWFAGKYSYHRSPYYNEEANIFSNAIKDYDGISFWLSVRPKKLLEGRARELWPGWLGLAVGYSGTNLGHEYSGWAPGGESNGGPDFVHKRQLFIGPDLDVIRWAAERAEEPWRTVGRLLEFVRLPAPALQLTPEVRLYWVFY